MTTSELEYDLRASASRHLSLLERVSAAIEDPTQKGLERYKITDFLTIVPISGEDNKVRDKTLSSKRYHILIRETYRPENYLGLDYVIEQHAEVVIKSLFDLIEFNIELVLKARESAPIIEGKALKKIPYAAQVLNILFARNPQLDYITALLVKRYDWRGTAGHGIGNDCKIVLHDDSGRKYTLQPTKLDSSSTMDSIFQSGQSYILVADPPVGFYARFSGLLNRLNGNISERRSHLPSVKVNFTPSGPSGSQFETIHAGEFKTEYKYSRDNPHTTESRLRFSSLDELKASLLGSEIRQLINDFAYIESQGTLPFRVENISNNLTGEQYTRMKEVVTAFYLKIMPERKPSVDSYLKLV